MAVEAHEAAYLCTPYEFALYRESCDPWIRQSAGENIRRHAPRALQLGAMWKAKADSDHEDTRVRNGRAKEASQTGHEFAQRKSDLFDQIAARFTDRLHDLGEMLGFVRGSSGNTSSGDSTDFNNP